MRLRTESRDEVTARMGSSVCRLLFISSWPFAGGSTRLPLVRRHRCAERRQIRTSHVELVLAGDGRDLGRLSPKDRDDDGGLGGLGLASKRGLQRTDAP